MMRYRRLGRTNLMVSELSFGAARGAAVDPDGFIATVHAAIDAGVNFIDTAESYDDGLSEQVLGRALHGRDDVLVETKYRPYDSHAPNAAWTGSPEALIASVDRSLGRLGRDHVDVLLGHGIRTLATLDRFVREGCLDAMVELRDAGKARFIGVSELSEADGEHTVLREAVPTGRLDVVMLTLNFLLQTAARGVLPLCAEHDVGTVVMMPLNQASPASGLVSEAAALACVRRHIEAGTLPEEPRYARDDLLAFLRPYAIPEAALRYVLAHEVSTCCVGMRSPARVRENLRAVDPPYLDDAWLTELRRLFGGITEQVR